MVTAHFDLASSAYQEMLHQGFAPDFPAEVQQQVAALRSHPNPAATDGLRDLRSLLWSSIDNDTSRDLDQIEVAEQTEDGIKVLVGIADVDSDVAAGSPIDRHAASQTTSVYTPARVFPMLPDALSTGITSLNPNADRSAVVIEFIVRVSGEVGRSNIYRALVHNHAQLTYNATGAWLTGTAPAPPLIASNPALAAQLKLQHQAAAQLREKRHQSGGLFFDRIETTAIVEGSDVKAITERPSNPATNLIEDFMIAANEVMARRLSDARIAHISRIVRQPKRWDRIVDIAAAHGTKLPEEPNSIALGAFLSDQRQRDPEHYPDLSLSILKSMGSGEYALQRPGEDSPGHFALAAHDYTHFTAPNRRFPDLVTQRLIKAVLAGNRSPYSDGELNAIATNCTLKEHAARKVERNMQKRVAALALRSRIGQRFNGIITGVNPSGTFVRIFNPPVEGMLVRGAHGVDVGDKVNVTLVHADPERGFIDFARA